MILSIFRQPAEELWIDCFIDCRNCPAIMVATMFLCNPLNYPIRVYLTSTSPPVKFPNLYGINMAPRAEFVANGRTVDEVGGLNL